MSAMELQRALAALLTAVITTLTLITLAVVSYLVIVRRSYAHIPSPKHASFLFGHVSEIFRLEKKGMLYLDVLLKWYMDTGPVFVVWLIHYPLVVVTDTESAKVVMSQTVLKPNFESRHYLFGNRTYTNTLFNIRDYGAWKGRRRILDNAFTRSYLRSLVIHFDTVAREYLVPRLKLASEQEKVINIRTEFSNAAFRSISRAAFALAVSDEDRLVKSLLEFAETEPPSEIALYTKGKDMLLNPFLKYFRPWSCKGHSTEAVRMVQEIGRLYIEQRIKTLENNVDVPQDILTQLLKIAIAEKKIAMKELLDEFVVFYFAGEETTAPLLSFATVMLHENPAVLQRVIDEIHEVVGGKESVEPDDLGNLKYLHQVLEETLRLYPSSAVIFREAPKNLQLCGYNIPSGSILTVSSYVMHRRSEVFANPEKFNPDRFSSDHKRPSPYDYFPFGVGHRSCIGRVFAIMEAKVMLVHFLRNFAFTVQEDYKITIVQNGDLIKPGGRILCTVACKE